MQFVALIYQGSSPLPGTPEWEALPSEEQRAIYADYGALREVEAMTSGLPLGLPAQATTVRVEGGRPVATEGPYVDAAGAIGGYVIIDADDLDAAVGLAARIPAARLGGAIEVRPVETYW